MATLARLTLCVFVMWMGPLHGPYIPMVSYDTLDQCLDAQLVSVQQALERPAPRRYHHTVCLPGTLNPNR